MIYPSPLGAALANQRKHLRNCWTAVVACVLLLACALIAFFRWPDISGHDKWVGVAVIVILVICISINVHNIIRTRKLLRQFW